MLSVSLIVPSVLQTSLDSKWHMLISPCARVTTLASCITYILDSITTL